MHIGQKLRQIIVEKLGVAPLLLTLLLHALFIVFIGFGWQSMALVRPVSMPGHVNVTMVDASKLITHADVLKKNILREKKAKLKKRAIQKEKRIAEKKRKRALQIKKKKAKAKKKRAELNRKKALLKKKEAIKKEKEHKEQQALKEKREEEQALVAKERKKSKKEEIDKKQLSEKELAREKALKKVMEKALKEEALRAQTLKKQAELAKYKEKMRLAQIAANEKVKRELSEVEKYTARIKAMITNRWHVPISADSDMRVVLQITLLPTGELNSVQISQSSGNQSFDNSAKSAVTSITQYPVPEDNVIFENNFRKFLMGFSPEDQQK